VHHDQEFRKNGLAKIPVRRSYNMAERWSTLSKRPFHYFKFNQEYLIPGKTKYTQGSIYHPSPRIEQKGMARKNGRFVRWFFSFISFPWSASSQHHRMGP
jgi:hypothetical protein